MPKQMTKAERAAYQRDYRNRKKREELARGEIGVRVDTVDKPVDVSTIAQEQHPELPPTRPLVTVDWRKKLLAAPDDDCVTCHHDRHTTHPDGGACKAPTGNGRTCLCRRFHAAGTVVTPCFACGHDEDHGHAMTPCDQWGPHGPCGCPAWTPALDTEVPF